MKIRIALEKDYEILKLYDCHVSGNELKKIIADQRIYILELNGEFIGWLRYNLFWDNTPFMNMLFILEEHQGKGYGRKLVKYWEEKMRLQKYDTLMTSTQEKESAKYFYEKMGYKNIGKFKPKDEGYEIILAK